MKMKLNSKWILLLVLGTVSTAVFAVSATDCAKMKNAAKQQACLKQAIMDKAKADFDAKYKKKLQAPEEQNKTPTQDQMKKSSFAKPARPELPKVPAQRLDLTNGSGAQSGAATTSTQTKKKPWWSFEKPSPKSNATNAATSHQSSTTTNSSSGSSNGHLNIYK